MQFPFYFRLTYANKENLINQVENATERINLYNRRYNKTYTIKLSHAERIMGYINMKNIEVLANIKYWIGEMKRKTWKVGTQVIWIVEL